LDEQYFFRTSAYDDNLAPTLEQKFPPENSVTVSPVTPIYFFVTDNNQCGVAIDCLSVDLTLYNQGESGYGKNVPVMKHGVFLPGYTGTVIPDVWGNMYVTVIPRNPFDAGITVNCHVAYEDLARIPNTGEGNWSFKIMATGEYGDLSSGTLPLAYPTIYDPLNNNVPQELTFTLRDDADITIHMYDLSGDMIWSYSKKMSAGYRSIPWDGRDAHNKLVGNGPYIWYIINNDKKKVIGRGTSIIMK
jgi:hypothetical protein